MTVAFFFHDMRFILPSVMSCSKTSFLITCPNHLYFRCQIVFNRHLSLSTFSSTDAAVTYIVMKNSYQTGIF